MTIQEHIFPDATAHPAGILEFDAPPGGWGKHVATVASQIGSPPVTVPLAMALQAAAVHGTHPWTWMAVYTLLAIATPIIYLVWLRLQGRVSDLDVRVRRQRVRPMICAVICAGAAWLVLWVGAAPRPMILLAGATWLQSAIIFTITLRWKISVHCAAAAMAGGLTWHLTGSPLPLCVGVPLIAWSRLRLRRHTLPQTVAGAALGLLTTLLVLG